MEECNKELTYLERLEIVSKYLGSEKGTTTVETLKKKIDNSIKILKRNIIKNKLSEELINKIESTLTNSYVKISYKNSEEFTYTKLTYVKMEGDEYKFRIEYMYDFDFCIDVDKLEGTISYDFSTKKEDNIFPPYYQEFNYCDDIEAEIYKVFQVINKNDLDAILDSLINTIKVYA